MMDGPLTRAMMLTCSKSVSPLTRFFPQTTRRNKFGHSDSTDPSPVQVLEEEQ